MKRQGKKRMVVVPGNARAGDQTAAREKRDKGRADSSLGWPSKIPGYARPKEWAAARKQNRSDKGGADARAGIGRVRRVRRVRHEREHDDMMMATKKANRMSSFYSVYPRYRNADWHTPRRTGQPNSEKGSARGKTDRRPAHYDARASALIG